MKCECCHENEATVHLTQVVNGEVKKLNLCQSCAEANGVSLKMPVSITEILLGLGGKKPAGETPARFELTCKRCQLTQSEFKKGGRLGCPECYKAFMGELASVVKAMHHNVQHVGKIPARQGSEARRAAKIAALQDDIRSAVAKEDYEEAARLRDEISALRADSAEEVRDDA